MADDDGKRCSVRGQWGVLEYPLTDLIGSSEGEAIIWYDGSGVMLDGRRVPSWEYVLPIDVTDLTPPTVTADESC